MNKNILFFAFTFSFASLGTQAEVTSIELSVKPDLHKEFVRPLPELYVFAADGSCQLHTRGFATEAELGRELHVAFGLDDNSPDDTSTLANGMTRDELLQMLIKSNPKLANMDTATQQDVINQVAQQYSEQIKSTIECDTRQDTLIEKLQNQDKSPLDAKKLIADRFVVYEFFADWCEPCKKQRAFLNKYLHNKKLNVAWLHIERDGNKQEK